MNDNLERYIRKNRNALDNLEPPIDIWQRIQKKQQRNKIFNLNRFWKAAAIVFFAISVGLWLNRPTGEFPVAEDSHLNEEMLLVEQYYTSLINEKIYLISSTEVLNPSIEREFLQDVEKLDSAYQQLKLTMEVTPSDKIKDAMIVNLQMRIELLNKQLEILEKIKSVKKDEEEYNT